MDTINPSTFLEGVLLIGIVVAVWLSAVLGRGNDRLLNRVRQQRALDGSSSITR